MTVRMSSFLLCLLVGCGNASADLVTPATPEGPDEFDPTQGAITGPTSGTSTSGTPTTTSGTTTTTGTVTGLEVCYPGPLGDYSVCLPVVSAVGLGPDYAYLSPLGGSVQYSVPVTMLDLDAVASSTAIAANFVLDEVAQAWKGQWGLVQPHAIENLQAMRDDAGGILINSGYRSPAYNMSVGGAEYSRHMYGDAFDMVGISIGLEDLADLCYTHGAGFVSVYVSHVHCDWRDDPLDSVFFGTASPYVYWPASRPFRGAELVQVGAVLQAPAQGWDEGEPLRTWRVYDVDGQMILEQDAFDLVVPEGAASATVTVGLEFTLVFDLP
ncbi:MAG: hypothetical protein GWP91_02190 [Rhodobacterales bacterium]|nr:hypothetical protein [Rhodobacterales bacterium]